VVPRAADDRMNDSGAVAWQVAEVLESRGGQIRLRFARPRSCQRCSEGRGCGAGVFGALFRRRDLELDMPGTPELEVGQWVRVGIPSATLLLTAFAVYGLPLAGFLIGALPAHWWIESPLWRDLLSLVGGLVLAIVAWRGGGFLARFWRQPHIEPLSCRREASR
jgi:sigma-E factor negative regulatory protein RseC